MITYIIVNANGIRCFDLKNDNKYIALSYDIIEGFG